MEKNTKRGKLAATSTFKMLPQRQNNRGSVKPDDTLYEMPSLDYISISSIDPTDTSAFLPSGFSFQSLPPIVVPPASIDRPKQKSKNSAFCRPIESPSKIDRSAVHSEIAVGHQGGNFRLQLKPGRPATIRFKFSKNEAVKKQVKLEHKNAAIRTPKISEKTFPSILFDRKSLSSQTAMQKTDKSAQSSDSFNLTSQIQVASKKPPDLVTLSVKSTKEKTARLISPERLVFDSINKTKATVVKKFYKFNGDQLKSSVSFESESQLSEQDKNYDHNYSICTYRGSPPNRK